jgi:hypothetical protein
LRPFLRLNFHPSWCEQHLSVELGPFVDRNCANLTFITSANVILEHKIDYCALNVVHGQKMSKFRLKCSLPRSPNLMSFNYQKVPPPLKGSRMIFPCEHSWAWNCVPGHEMVVPRYKIVYPGMKLCTRAWNGGSQV